MSTLSWNPKGLREYLCRQSVVAPTDEVGEAISALIRVLDSHRPLGSDGKHGDSHTDFCGCIRHCEHCDEDVEIRPTVFGTTRWMHIRILKLWDGTPVRASLWERCEGKNTTATPVIG